MNDLWINGEVTDVSSIGGNENLLAFLRGNGRTGRFTAARLSVSLR
jgi:hypothetical protein|tara:strand:- start:6955 stop:7092 length:138 start_codon:yes stop_codon:yes gene_type:complete